MDVAGFADWVLTKLNDGYSWIYSAFDLDVCPYSPSANKTHNFEKQHTTVNGKLGYYNICQYCGRSAGEVFEQSYDTQVSALPAQGYNSAGKLVWQPKFSDFEPSSCFKSLSFEELPYDYTPYRISALSSGDGLCINIFSDYENSSWSIDFNNCYIYVPISGYYKQVKSICATGGIISDFYYKEEKIATSKYIELGDSFYWNYTDYSFPKVLSPGIYCFYFPVFEVIPETALPGDTYNITSRPTSITGDYGIIGDNGQITKVEGNTIINETNNTYYNPATGQTDTITDWSYNYEDRSYTLTLGGGTTSTVTYGDENVTIQEGDTTYNVYYLVEDSGSDTPAPGPDTPCTHTWTETSATPATCTVPGSRHLTCSLCGETKTEAVPAPGHTWQIKQTVQTQYDDTGQLTQQGYTIFECGVCHEQYKSEDGTAPPGGGSGTDPGGGESLWDKLGSLIGSGLGGLIGLIEAVFGKLLDALTSLVEMITGKLTEVVEALLSIFDQVPALFGGFLGFLSAVFPFLPPEITALLTLGIAAVVFIGIIKAIRR